LIPAAGPGAIARTMNAKQWHYALDGEQKGPVSAEDFERLVSAGVVGRDTLVWTDGMAAWEALAQVLPDTIPAPAPPAFPSPSSTAIPGAGQAVCAQCGQIVSTEDVVPLAGRMICAHCKPLAVQMLKEGVNPVNAQAEQVRREHLKHEASIRAVGMLYVLLATILSLSGLLGAIGLFFSSSAGAANPAGGQVRIAAASASISLGLAAVLFVVGFGLRRLNPSARIAAAVLSGIGLLGFPVGTLINGYILWLLLSRKGKRVFSDEYRRIRAETPHIRYRTPVWPWVLVALLIVGLFLLVAYFTQAR
jgi:hypothetical protein